MNVLSCSSNVKPPNTSDIQNVNFVCPEIRRLASHNAPTCSVTATINAAVA